MALTNAQLMQQLVDILDRFNGREDEFQTWLAGAADGGPSGDGRYPLSDLGGSVRQTKSPARLEADVQGLVDSSQSHRDDAQAAQAAAEAARDTAVTNATASGTNFVAADNARVNSQAARDTAAGHATTAQANATKARDWANADSGVEVEPGEYSAKHYVLQLGSLAAVQQVVDDAAALYGGTAALNTAVSDALAAQTAAEAARDAAQAAEAGSLSRLAVTVGHQATMASALAQMARTGLDYNPPI